MRAYSFACSCHDGCKMTELGIARTSLNLGLQQVDNSGPDKTWGLVVALV